MFFSSFVTLHSSIVATKTVLRKLSNDLPEQKNLNCQFRLVSETIMQPEKMS